MIWVAANAVEKKSRPLHEALGTGLASQVYAIWHGLEMREVPLVILLVKQESHRAGVGNHEADEAAQAVDKEQEPKARVPEEGSTSTWCTYHQGWPTRREPSGWSRETGADRNYECTRSQCTC